jgi:protein ImuB
MYACLYRPPDHDDQQSRAVLSGPPPRGARRALSVQDSAISADSALHVVNILVPIAQEFSPRYESSGDVVSIDVRGLERLLGHPRTIGEELRREAARRGVRVHVALAGTRTAALMLALSRPGLTVVDPGEEAEALAPLPIGILENLPHDQPQRTQRSQRHKDSKDSACTAIAAVKRWGIRTLGEMAALPSADLSARLGRQGLVWQAIARGEDIRPLVPDVAEERFESSMELEWPIEGLEPMSFVLTRLLEPLSVRLERRDRGVAVLHVQLGLVAGDTYTRSLQLPSPMRDVRTLRTLALLDLESHPPPAAVDRVALVIDPTPGRVVQHTLFARPHLTPEQISTLLARLGAVMGQDRIGAPATMDSYRPGAFVMKPFATEHDVTKNRGARSDRREISSENSASAASAAVNRDDAAASSLQPRATSPEPRVTALRRCRHPVPARVAADTGGRPVRVTTDRRGFAGGSVVSASGPWKTSGEWWAEEAGKVGRAGGAGPWDRDEWDVTLNDGGAYRIFVDRVTGGWFIDAICD